MHVLVQIGLVALGGAVGTLLRWGVGVAFARALGTAFPWGTFFINVTGSFFLGWFYAVLDDRFFASLDDWISPGNLRLLIATGFTGGYTTFSTFEYESHKLVQDGDILEGMTYLFGSVFLGLLAVRLGVMLAKASG